MAFLQCECEGKFFPQEGYSVNFEEDDGTFECYNLFTDVMQEAVKVCRRGKVCGAFQVCRLLSGDGSTAYATWVGGHCLFPIQLAQHLPSLRYSNPKMSGMLNAKIRFRNQLQGAVNVYCFAISSTQLTITRDGNIVLPSTQ